MGWFSRSRWWLWPGVRGLPHYGSNSIPSRNHRRIQLVPATQPGGKCIVQWGQGPEGFSGPANSLTRHQPAMAYSLGPEVACGIPVIITPCNRGARDSIPLAKPQFPGVDMEVLPETYGFCTFVYFYVFLDFIIFLEKMFFLEKCRSSRCFLIRVWRQISDVIKRCFFDNVRAFLAQVSLTPAETFFMKIQKT